MVVMNVLSVNIDQMATSSAIELKHIIVGGTKLLLESPVSHTPGKVDNHARNNMITIITLIMIIVSLYMTITMIQNYLK